MIKGIHHIAIIASDYEVSKQFYIDVLGFFIIQETYRSERKSYKLDLAVNGNYQIELFSFPTPPPRSSFPEATGLRHLAFALDNFDQFILQLKSKGVKVETIRIDELTDKKFTFIEDPDKLPIEFYEM